MVYVCTKSAFLRGGVSKKGGVGLKFQFQETEITDKGCLQIN